MLICHFNSNKRYGKMSYKSILRTPKKEGTLEKS
jgi:hypothetical protein